MGQFSGVHTRKQPGRLMRGSDGESSSENRAIPQRTFAYYTVLHAASLSYNRLTRRLQSTYSSPDRAIAGHGRAGAKQTRTATGMRDDVGAGLDTRVDYRAERGDGDAYSQGVGFVAETALRRCTGLEPMLMASRAVATVTSRTGVRRSYTRLRHSPGHCCRRRCRCAGHSRSRR